MTKTKCCRSEALIGLCVVTAGRGAFSLQSDLLVLFLIPHVTLQACWNCCYCCVSQMLWYLTPLRLCPNPSRLSGPLFVQYECGLFPALFFFFLCIRPIVSTHVSQRDRLPPSRPCVCCSLFSFSLFWSWCASQPNTKEHSPLSMMYQALWMPCGCPWSSPLTTLTQSNLCLPVTTPLLQHSRL